MPWSLPSHRAEENVKKLALLASLSLLLIPSASSAQVPEEEPASPAEVPDEESHWYYVLSGGLFVVTF
jgi:hypothetical protein